MYDENFYFWMGAMKPSLKLPSHRTEIVHFWVPDPKLDNFPCGGVITFGEHGYCHIEASGLFYSHFLPPIR